LSCGHETDATIYARLAFVVLATVIAGTYCWVATLALPPLRNEPLSFLVLPMTAITGVVASLFYPLLQQQQGPRRVLRMYLASLVSLALYGLYLWWFIPDGAVGLIVLALLAGHFYGWPAFLAVLLATSLMDRFLFPSSPTARNADQK
jgi:hypothetical protein